jgi:predicted methyltransferase
MRDDKTLEDTARRQPREALWRGLGCAVLGLALCTACVLAAAAPATVARQASREVSRESWQHVPEVFKALGVGEGSAVADVGAGSGFFTVRLSKLVGEKGRVLAVDVDKGVVHNLQTRVESESLSNVEVIQGVPDDPKLPEGALDAVLIVNAYHEMKAHQSMLDHLKRALKPGGRLVLVEPNHPSEHGKTREELALDHLIDPDSVRQDLKEAGFEVIDFKEQFAKQNNLRIEFLMVATAKRD